jgi:signal transduction histidine kinase
MINYTLSQEKVSLHSFSSITTYPLQGALVLLILTLLLTPVVGGLFGTLTTRGLIQRVRYLIWATTQVTNGYYTQRVSVSVNDELGQLEQQFNRMAEQLAENITRRQELVEQNAKLAERTRISRELHDAISQDLFSLRMLTTGLHMALPATSDLQPRIAAVEQTVISMIHEMQALLLELRPIQLDQFGLAKALEKLAATYSARLAINVKATITAIQLTTKVEHTLLRIAQEALTNAVRHADATEIRVSLIPQEDQVVLTITDNGKGLPEGGSDKKYGFGLQSMQERIQEIKGDFKVETSQNHGTQVIVCVPQEQKHDTNTHCG